MKPYSDDLRTRILAAVAAGMSKCQAARVFGVSRSTIKLYAQRRRETGSLAPTPRVAPRSSLIGPAQQDALRAQLDAAPDAPLATHCAIWEREHGVRVSVSTMHRAIARVGWTRKKRASPPASATRSPVMPGKTRSPHSIPPPLSSSTRPGPTGA
jgi:transposase